MTHIITIGNSDNKLTQAEWSQFCTRISSVVSDYAEIVYGMFFSESSTPYQNACWTFEMKDTFTQGTENLRSWLRVLANEYKQDSIMFAEFTANFVTAVPNTHCPSCSTKLLPDGRCPNQIEKVETGVIATFPVEFRPARETTFSWDIGSEPAVFMIRPSGEIVRVPNNKTDKGN